MRLKRWIAIALIAVLALSVLVSCSEEEDAGVVYYTVTFNSNGGGEVAPQEIIAGKKAYEPVQPTREGYIFGGWYEVTDESTNQVSLVSWDFDIKIVKEDVTLKAEWLSPEHVFKFEKIEGRDEIAVVGVKSNVEASVLTLPREANGYAVTTVGYSAFENIKSKISVVERIILPDTVTNIEENAFKTGGDVEIVIEGALTYIGEFAFMGCTGLKSIRLGEGLEYVSAEAFRDCTFLKSINIPKSVRYIDENAFDACTSLRTVVFYTDIEEIREDAFNNTEVSNLCFYGTDEEIDEFLSEKVSKTARLLSDTQKIYVHSSTEPTGTTKYNGFWYLDGNGQMRQWK